MKIYFYNECNDDTAPLNNYVRCFDNKEAACEYLAECVKNDYGCELSELKAEGDELVSDTLVVKASHRGYNYYSVEEYEMDLTEKTRREMYLEQEKAYDVQDIKDIIDGNQVDLSAVIINEEDMENIQKRYRDKYDWTIAEKDDLEYFITEYLQDKKLNPEVEYCVSFVNPEAKLNYGYDEITFEGVNHLGELGQLWVEFAKENNFDVHAVTGYSEVQA